MSMDLTLYQIEADLVELVDLREQVLSDPALSPEEKASSLETVEMQIREYLEREITKVDGVRGWFKSCVAMAAAAKQEAQVQSARARAWEDRLEHLKSMCASVMEMMGKKKLEGRTGSIMLKGNGGKQPVNVYNPELVPDELCTFTVKVSGDVIEDIREQFPGADISRIPSASLIYEALSKPCYECGGVPMPLNTDCPVCGGSGLAGVPGARLEPRGQHIEVK